MQRYLILFLLIGVGLRPLRAQQPAPASSSPDAASKQQQDTPEKKVPDAPVPKTEGAPSNVNKDGTSNDRLFFTLPNFLTLENANQIKPLTAGQKYKAVTRSTFDYIQFPWWGFLAGISQAQNSEPGYGQGAEGYGKRFGAAVADGTIENYMVSAVLPSMLHQDPRFFQSGHGGFWHRTYYSLSRMVITRGDNGNEEFNYSEVFGSAFSAGVSTYSYHPHDDKTLANTSKVWGTQIGYDALTYVVKEFWPDIRRSVFHRGTPHAGPQKDSKSAD